jgi:hypothetical protein
MTQFRIADSFAKALGKLSAPEQSATKVTVFDLQQDPSSPGLKFHRIDKSKDPNFWSIRVNRDVRVVVHKTDASFLTCYVAHHDDAYKWAERRRIETHPRTGASQIVEVRERIEEIPLPVFSTPELQPGKASDVTQAKFLAPLFSTLSNDDLLDVGVPEDWIGDVRSATEDNFFDLTDHIPAEASEALLDFVSTGVLVRLQQTLAEGNPFDHPDAQRRFRVMEDIEELSRALDYPWDQWVVFLHPSQKSVVEQRYSGPARVSGSAGTGKTVVALHRAANLLINDTNAKVLLTTFSSPLANALSFKLDVLAGTSKEIATRATVLPFSGVAKELFALAFGYNPRPANTAHVEDSLEAAAEEFGNGEFTNRFLISEWRNVVDAWQIETLDAYLNVPRLGRKNRMGAKQRERVWPVFIETRRLLESQGVLSWPEIFGRVTSHHAAQSNKPFTHIIVDEAQDLGVPELRMLSALAGDQDNALFFAGDLGQRIFQEPFSWLTLSVDIRGRSQTLKVNYRTSHQIRQAVDRLLPKSVRDVDGVEEDRTGTISVFNGPDPEVQILQDIEAEVSAISVWIGELIENGMEADEIGIFVRSDAELGRARAVVKATGQKSMELSDRVEERNGRMSIGTMHLAKGLEFKSVVVMACDDNILPLQERIDTVADESELDEVFETERHLLYVACTRARDRLLVTGVEPASEFFEDMREKDE